MFLVNYTKLLITTGGHDRSAEIVDLSDPHLICNPLMDIPYSMDYASGAGKLLFSYYSSPLVRFFKPNHC